MNGISLRIAYLLNPNLKEHTEKVFQGIEAGRTKALYNWFNDIWTSIELTQNKLMLNNRLYMNNGNQEVIRILEDQKLRFEAFSELFIVDDRKTVVASTFKTFIDRKIDHEYIGDFDANQAHMYGPYTDQDTLTIGTCASPFFDAVTLMFISPIAVGSRCFFLCGRVPNDVMSDVLQDEDSHIYKESGDNYLFMVKNKRGIPTGSAISRSRFEDNAFTLGENLKDGIQTKGYGKVQIKEHTEFEIIFNNPKTGQLHEGVQKTIAQGENLEAWPGYPEYRHILVGGKGILINPPFTEEQWGLLCEGDIEEIYKYKSVNLKLFLIVGILNALALILMPPVVNEKVFVDVVLKGLIWVATMAVTLGGMNLLFVKPLKKSIDFLKNIAEGEGDLTKRINISSNDELGELARWFNKFVNNQMQIVKRIINATTITNKSVEELSELTIEIKDSKGHMADSIESLITTMGNYTGELVVMQEKFEVISKGIAGVFNIIEEAKTQMDLINEKAIESRKSSEEASVIMDEMVGDISNTHKGMRELEKHSINITRVVEVIDSISSQTKLLALNASIEAARAGQHGLGFSVVAEEISKLAHMTTESTTEIDILITNIKEEVARSKGHISYMDDKIKRGSTSVNHSINSFMVIQKDISIMATDFKEVAVEMEAKTKDIKDIEYFVQEAVKQFEATTAENEVECNSALLALTNHISNMQEIKESLEYTSKHLYDMVNEFTI